MLSDIISSFLLEKNVNHNFSSCYLKNVGNLVSLNLVLSLAIRENVVKLKNGSLGLGKYIEGV